MSFISSWFLVVKRERRERKRESGGGQNTNEKETRRVELTASPVFSFALRVVSQARICGYLVIRCIRGNSLV